MTTWITDRAKQLGIPVVDATAPLLLEVTKNDISVARPKDPQQCAFACAVKRGLGAKAAYFYRSVAWVEYGDRIVRYEMPPSMQKEIVAFDRARAMEPGVYQLSRVPRLRRSESRALESARRRRDRKSVASGARSARSRSSRSGRVARVSNIRTMVSPK